jgi:hypothetical protein
LADDQIQPPPAFGTRVQLDFLRGLTEVDGHFALILDLNRLLTTEELLNMDLDEPQTVVGDMVVDVKPSDNEDSQSFAAAAGQQ